MLLKNKEYRITDLLHIFGGNAQSSMPLVNGKVPYCKFNPKLNPNFPSNAWIEVGPIRKKGAVYLIKCKMKIPVFQKKAPNIWKYIGKAKISNITTFDELNIINKNPPRNKVQLILKFNFN